MALATAVLVASVGSGAEAAPERSAQAGASDAGAARAQVHAAARRCRGWNRTITRRRTRSAERTMRCIHNRIRVDNDRGKLRYSSRLTRAARAHTRDMIRRRFFEHEGPGGPTFEERLRKVRWRGLAGENIVWMSGRPTPQKLMDLWVDSPGHFENIVRDEFRYIGVSIQARAPRRGVRGRAATATAVFGG